MKTYKINADQTAVELDVVLDDGRKLMSRFTVTTEDKLFKVKLNEVQELKTKEFWISDESIRSDCNCTYFDRLPSEITLKRFVLNVLTDLGYINKKVILNGNTFIFKYCNEGAGAVDIEAKDQDGNFIGAATIVPDMFSELTIAHESGIFKLSNDYLSLLWEDIMTFFEKKKQKGCKLLKINNLFFTKSEV